MQKGTPEQKSLPKTKQEKKMINSPAVRKKSDTNKISPQHQVVCQHFEFCNVSSFVFIGFVTNVCLPLSCCPKVDLDLFAKKKKTVKFVKTVN